jgi:hypothetical protein
MPVALAAAQARAHDENRERKQAWTQVKPQQLINIVA